MVDGRSQSQLPLQRLRELSGLSGAALEALLRGGSAPELDVLAGYEFCGYNVAWPTELLRIRKFKKVFEPHPHRPDRLVGHNLVCLQDGRERPWLERMRHGEPVREGAYEVRRVLRIDPDHRYPRALLLDYGAGSNRFFEPARLLRDYLVQPDPHDPDVLLGKAYASLGPWRIAASFFILARECPTPCSRRSSTL